MKIAVVCGMSDEKVRARLMPLVEIDGIEQIYLIRRSPFDMRKVKTLSPPIMFRWFLPFVELFRIMALCFVCIKEKPSCIYGIYFVPHGIYAGIFGKIFKIPVIQELIGTDRPKVARVRLFQKLLAQAKYIGVRGSISRQEIVSWGVAEENIFISNAVNILDYKLFSPDNSPKIYDLIYCGYMDQNKQVDLLIDAVKNLNQEIPDLRVVLVGDGPERSALEMKATSLGVDKQINFVGKQPIESVPSFLNQSRVFVMTSAFEGLPVAMLEALSCGLPVVIPDVGDISDVAIHGINGLLFEANNVSSLTNYLRKVLIDESLYQKLRNGAEEMHKHFINSYTIKHTQQTWESMLGL